MEVEIEQLDANEKKITSKKFKVKPTPAGGYSFLSVEADPKTDTFSVDGILPGKNLLLSYINGPKTITGTDKDGKKQSVKVAGIYEYSLKN